jgi:signal transduction histidine kinase
MGASGQQKVGKLFEAAGYEVTQAVGLAAGEVDWFATPRAGLSRPRTYFAAWERCPEALPEALAELERARVARRADKALGVVMEGRLSEGYKTDFGRAAEVVTFRRLALEVSGIADRVREQVRAYEAEDGPSLYLPLRGRLQSGEDVDAAAYIKEWASEGTTDNLIIIYPYRSSRLTPIRQASYEIGARFELDPERALPLVSYKRDDVLIPYEAGFAVPVLRHSGTDHLGAMRRIVLMPDVDPDDDLEGRRLEVVPPTSSELDGWFHHHLGAQAYARLVSARDTEPAFRALSDEWRNATTFVVAMRAAPRGDRTSTAEWIAHVVARYMDAEPEEALDGAEDAALGQFAFGVGWNRTDTRAEIDPWPPPEWLDNWKAFHDGADPILNRLVRDYLVARRIAHDVDSGRIEILTRHQFPKEYVLLFLAVISPSAAERAAEMRTQIEAEVERRLQLTLAHQLKRSVGALRLHVKSIRRTIARDEAEALAREFSRIEEELSFLSALERQTHLWHEVPNGALEGLAVEPFVTVAADPLRERYPAVHFEAEIGDAVHVRATKGVLREIFHCLIENAFHAAIAPGAHAPPIVRVRVLAGPETVRVDVLDSGPGVPPPDRERIFEPYVTNKKGGDQVLGTGLGLAIARRYAERVGGRVGLDPDGPETCFFVELLAWRDPK